MAQNQYKIKLSSPDAKTFQFDQNGKRIPFLIREGEISALDNIISLASTKESLRGNGQFMLCADLIHQLANLSDEEEFWIVTESDLNLIIEGFDMSQKPEIYRPMQWTRLRDLFRQLKNFPERYFPGGQDSPENLETKPTLTPGVESIKSNISPPFLIDGK